MKKKKRGSVFTSPYSRDHNVDSSPDLEIVADNSNLVVLVELVAEVVKALGVVQLSQDQEQGLELADIGSSTVGCIRSIHLPNYNILS
jgi:hypothetical protein